MRAGSAVVVLALAVSAVPARATGPLDPPSSRLVVQLLERTSASAGPLKLTMRLRATQDTGAIVSVGFRRGKAGQRQVLDGARSFYIEARRGGVWPVVSRDGAAQAPSCPASGLCSIPAAGADNDAFDYTPKERDLSYYLFVRDVPDIAYTVSPGWRMREVKGGELLQYRDTWTSARVSAYDRQYAYEDFRGVSSPRVSGPSVAFASIPCWFPPFPSGDGRAVLKNGTNARGTWRTMDCPTFRTGASGGSDTATAWRNDGAAAGWAGAQVNRLVVAVLPPR